MAVHAFLGPNGAQPDGAISTIGIILEMTHYAPNLISSHVNEDHLVD